MPDHQITETFVWSLSWYYSLLVTQSNFIYYWTADEQGRGHLSELAVMYPNKKGTLCEVQGKVASGISNLQPC